MFCWVFSLNTVILCSTDAWSILCTNKIYTYVLKKYFICPITKGSVNALMKLAGFSTSNKVKNHCPNQNPWGQLHFRFHNKDSDPSGA